MIDLKRLRKELGMTQLEMSDVLGIRQASYSKLENGGWAISPETEERYIGNIAKRFPDISLEDFKQPAAVHIQNIKSTLKGVKVSAIDERVLSVINEQGKQIAELIALVKHQNETITNLLKRKK